MTPFNPRDIEAAAQSAWVAADAYRAVERTDRKKFYCVSMLPYPSGRLHMGHVRNYTINDVMYRHLRMSVQLPDADGLGRVRTAGGRRGDEGRRRAREVEHTATSQMKRQCRSIGLRSTGRANSPPAIRPATAEPVVFPEDAGKGIAYRKTQVVNWDPVDQTVLPTSRSSTGGRAGAPVEKRRSRLLPASPTTPTNCSKRSTGCPVGRSA
jgi:leucyl-tRNA synthetase